MARMIDVDAFKQTFCEKCDRSQCKNCSITYHFEHFVPTIDVIDVVRCKDCKYYVEDINRYVCVNGNIDAIPTDYCSWGEKR